MKTQESSWPGRAIQISLASTFAVVMAVVPCHADGLRALASVLTPDPERPDLVLDTGLWRSEFLHRPAEEAPDWVNDSANAESARDNPITPAHRAVKQDDAPVMLVQIAEQYFENGDQALTQTATHEGGNSAPSIEVMSEWEHAVSHVGNLQKESTDHTGPSVITVIIAVVGTIVVGGAYFR